VTIDKSAPAPLTAAAAAMTALEDEQDSLRSSMTMNSRQAEIYFYEVKFVPNPPLNQEEISTMFMTIAGDGLEKEAKLECLNFDGKEVTFRTAHVTPFISDSEFLLTRHLLILLECETRGEDDVFSGLGGIILNFGYCVLPLKPIITNDDKTPKQFDCVVTREGQIIGNIQGNYVARYRPKRS